MPTPSLAESAANLHELGIHHDFIASRSSATLPALSADFARRLSSHQLQLPGWYTDAPLAQRQALHASRALSQQSLQAVQKVLEQIGSVESFAVPLLEQALLKEFGIACNVRQNVIGLTTLNAFTDEVERTDTLTLLQAALHNFAQEQASPGGIPGVRTCGAINPAAFATRCPEPWPSSPRPLPACAAGWISAGATSSTWNPSSARPESWISTGWTNYSFNMNAIRCGCRPILH